MCGYCMSSIHFRLWHIVQYVFNVVWVSNLTCCCGNFRWHTQWWIDNIVQVMLVSWEFSVNGDQASEWKARVVLEGNNRKAIQKLLASNKLSAGQGIWHLELKSGWLYFKVALAPPIHHSVWFCSRDCLQAGFVCNKIKVYYVVGFKDLLYPDTVSCRMLSMN